MQSFFKGVGILFIVIMLVACSQDKSSETPQLESGIQQTLSATATPVDSPFVALLDLPSKDIRLPEIEDLSGGLLLAVQDDNDHDSLYFTKFDGQPAHLLSDRVVSFRISVSPYDPLVAYPAHDGRSWHFMLTDLTTLETVQLLNIRQDGDINGWSPDGQWLSLYTTEEGLIIYHIPSESSIQVTGQSSSSVWLDDNTLIYLKPDEQSSNVALMRYLTEENRHEMLLENIPAARPQNLVALEAFLQEQDLHYPDGFNQFDRTADALDGQSRYVIDWLDAIWNGDLITCESWQITEYNLQGVPLNVVYEVDDTHFLTDLTLSKSGDLLFLKWSINNCTFGDKMQVSLLRVEPSGGINTITDNVYAGANRAVRDHRYTISNDGRFVFWIGNGMTTETIINVTDLDTNGTTTILTMDEFFTAIFESIIYVTG